MAAWTAYFAQLHTLYPNALLGFGEVGMDNPATPVDAAAARSVMAYDYGLRITLPYSVGGYSWWYDDEDCLPSSTSLLGPTSDPRSAPRPPPWRTDPVASAPWPKPASSTPRP
ncbi:MAG TPA: hypothetical protein VMV22_00470 [Acidimicrobiales bacterium]|nr:hypothetical protein [Acidimicrobiales bacterium]